MKTVQESKTPLTFISAMWKKFVLTPAPLSMKTAPAKKG